MASVAKVFLALTLPLLAGLPACGQFVQYTQEITDEQTGRTWFVRGPATLGGSLGFVVGIPADIVFLPVTYTVYKIEEANDPLHSDPLSTLLFPSFVCWQMGKLIAAPFDALEFVAYRAWRAPESLSEAEREAQFEREHDANTLPSYPVTPIYPPRRG